MLCHSHSTALKSSFLFNAKGGYGPNRREPLNCPLEQGGGDIARNEQMSPQTRTLGVYSRIERHGDRQTTGDWQFEVIVALGAPQSPQNANRPRSVCHPRDSTGDWQFEEKLRLGRNIFLKLSIAHVLSVTGPHRRKPDICPLEQGGLCSE